MAARRRWGQWPKRFTRELNGTAGLASMGGAFLTGLSFVGWTANSNVPVAVVGGVGLLITAGAVGAAAWTAIPPKFKMARDLVGERLDLGELDVVDPPLLKFSVVGPSLAGKSTLVTAVLDQPPPERTRGIHAYVAALQTAPTQYVAMLDASGGQFAGMFDIAAPADVVLIILDHNRLDDATTLDEARMVDHSRFQEQLRGFLKTRPRKRLWVHLLLNKRDLWERAPEGEHKRVVNFLRAEEQAWHDSNLAEQVTSARHSNRYAHDVGVLLKRIADFVKVRHGRK